MHRHIICPVQQVLVPIQCVIYVSNLMIIAPTIKVNLAQFYNINKITHETLLGLRGFH
jgi:hypothetical protein